MGLRPLEFWKSTPKEIHLVADGYFDNQIHQQREEWRRSAYLACWIVNQSGFSGRKTPLKPEDLIKFREEVAKSVEKDERKRKEREMAVLELQKKTAKHTTFKWRGGGTNEPVILGGDHAMDKRITDSIIKKYGIPETDEDFETAMEKAKILNFIDPPRKGKK